MRQVERRLSAGAKQKGRCSSRSSSQQKRGRPRALDQSREGQGQFANVSSARKGTGAGSFTRQKWRLSNSNSNTTPHHNTLHYIIPPHDIPHHINMHTKPQHTTARDRSTPLHTASHAALLSIYFSAKKKPPKNVRKTLLYIAYELALLTLNKVHVLFVGSVHLQGLERCFRVMMDARMQPPQPPADLSQPPPSLEEARQWCIRTAQNLHLSVLHTIPTHGQQLAAETEFKASDQPHIDRIRLCLQQLQVHAGWFSYMCIQPY